MASVEVYAWAGGIAGLAGGAALLLGGFALGRLRLPTQRTRAVPWRGSFCFLIALVLFVPQALVAVSILGDVKAATTDERLQSTMIASLVCLPFQAVLALRLLSRAEGQQLPLAGGRYRDGLLLGWAASLPLVIGTLGIHFLVRWLANVSGDSSVREHQLLQTLSARPDDLRLWMLITAQVVLAAPITEEIFFRGCLQPWFANRLRGGDIAIGVAMFAALVGRADAPTLLAQIGPVAYIAGAACTLWWADGALLRLRDWLGRFGQMLAPSSRDGSVTYHGVVGTSLLFAAVHSTSWPDPVPLTFLGLGLGWLAWRTQGITAPIVCHMLFNATMLMLQRISLIWPGSAG